MAPSYHRKSTSWQHRGQPTQDAVAAREQVKRQLSEKIIRTAWKMFEEHKRVPQDLSDSERETLNAKISDGLQFFDITGEDPRELKPLEIFYIFKKRLYLTLQGFIATDFVRLPPDEIGSQLEGTATVPWTYRTWLAQAYLYSIQPGLGVEEIKAAFRLRMKQDKDWAAWPKAFDQKFRLSLRVQPEDIFIKVEDEESVHDASQNLQPAVDGVNSEERSRPVNRTSPARSESGTVSNESAISDEVDQDRSATYRQGTYDFPESDSDANDINHARNPKNPRPKSSRLKSRNTHVVIPQHFAGASSYKNAPPSASPYRPTFTQEALQEARPGGRRASIPPSDISVRSHQHGPHVDNFRPSASANSPPESGDQSPTSDLLDLSQEEVNEMNEDAQLLRAMRRSVAAMKDLPASGDDLNEGNYLHRASVDVEKPEPTTGRKGKAAEFDLLTSFTKPPATSKIGHSARTRASGLTMASIEGAKAEADDGVMQLDETPVDSDALRTSSMAANGREQSVELPFHIRPSTKNNQAADRGASAKKNHKQKLKKLKEIPSKQSDKAAQRPNQRVSSSNSKKDEISLSTNELQSKPAPEDSMKKSQKAPDDDAQNIKSRLLKALLKEHKDFQSWMKEMQAQARTLTDRDAILHQPGTPMENLRLYRGPRLFNYMVHIGDLGTVHGLYASETMSSALAKLQYDLNLWYELQKGQLRPPAPASTKARRDFPTMTTKEKLAYIMHRRATFVADLGPADGKHRVSKQGDRGSEPAEQSSKKSNKRQADDSDDGLEIVGSQASNSLNMPKRTKREHESESEEVTPWSSQDHDIHMSDAEEASKDSTSQQRNTSSSQNERKTDGQDKSKSGTIDAFTGSSRAPQKREIIDLTNEDDTDEDTSDEADATASLNKIPKDGKQNYLCLWKDCREVAKSLKKLFFHVVDEHSSTRRCKWNACHKHGDKGANGKAIKKGFARRQDFLKHLSLHIPYRIYRCDRCTLGPHGTRNALYSHFQSRHPGYRPPKYLKGSLEASSPSFEDPTMPLLANRKSRRPTIDVPPEAQEDQSDDEMTEQSEEASDSNDEMSEGTSREAEVNEEESAASGFSDGDSEEEIEPTNEAVPSIEETASDSNNAGEHDENQHVSSSDDSDSDDSSSSSSSDGSGDNDDDDDEDDDMSIQESFGGKPEVSNEGHSSEGDAVETPATEIKNEAEELDHSTPEHYLSHLASSQSALQESLIRKEQSSRRCEEAAAALRNSERLVSQLPLRKLNRAGKEVPAAARRQRNEAQQDVSKCRALFKQRTKTLKHVETMIAQQQRNLKTARSLPKILERARLKEAFPLRLLATGGRRRNVVKLEQRALDELARNIQNAELGKRRHEKYRLLERQRLLQLALRRVDAGEVSTAHETRLMRTYANYRRACATSRDAEPGVDATTQKKVSKAWKKVMRALRQVEAQDRDEVAAVNRPS